MTQIIQYKRDVLALAHVYVVHVYRYVHIGANGCIQIMHIFVCGMIEDGYESPQSFSANNKGSF